MITLSVILRANKGRINSKGCAPICLVVNADGKRRLFSTGIKIAPAHFDSEKQKVLKSAPDYLHLSTLLAGYVSKAQKYVYDCDINEAEFDDSDFRKKIFPKNRRKVRQVNKNCFYAMLDRYVDATSPSYSVFRLYLRTGQRMRELYPKLNVDDVGFEHITMFQKLLKETYGDSLNTSKNYVKSIKAVLHFAEHLGHNINKTIGYAKTPTTETIRGILNYDKQMWLYDRFTKGELPRSPATRAFGYWLFSAFTGLRWCDVKANEGQTEKILEAGCISTIQMKSKKMVMVPLSAQARTLLQMGVINQVFCYGKSNEYVKATLKNELDIAFGEITYHCARHTFATNSLLLGIPVEVVQQFLGHKKIQTTMIYAKVADSIKEQSMNKWSIGKPYTAPVVSTSTSV